jgi:hypothetical protein
MHLGLAIPRCCKTVIPDGHSELDIPNASFLRPFLTPLPEPTRPGPVKRNLSAFKQEIMYSLITALVTSPRCLLPIPDSLPG